VAYIAFNDGVYAELLPVFYDAAVAANAIRTRFSGWTPGSVGIGDRAAQMSTGRVVAAFVYRTEYRVSFELRNLSQNGPSALNQLSIAQRLMRWSENGGAFDVFVQDDAATASRTAYSVAPMTLTLADPRLMLYTLSVTAISATAAPWVAIYGGALG